MINYVYIKYVKSAIKSYSKVINNFFIYKARPESKISYSAGTRGKLQTMLVSLSNRAFCNEENK